MSKRVKSFDYTATFRLEALNFDKAKARIADVDQRLERLGLHRTGETRLKERPDDDEQRRNDRGP